MKHKGFTFIELVIVIAIIGIITSTVMISFDSTRRRAIFQTEVSKIQDALTLARNRVKSDKNFGAIATSEEEIDSGVETDNSGGIIANFEFENNIASKLTVYSSDDLNSLEYNATTHELISELVLNQENSFLLINELVSKENSLESEPIVNDEMDNLYITYSKEGYCDFQINNNMDIINNIQLIQIPLKIKEEEVTTVRYLYLHKVACTPEILIDNLLER